MLDDGTKIVQSLAIIEWLEDLHPDPPLLPRDLTARALVRAAAQQIACDIHPINNLKVGQYLKNSLNHDQETFVIWMRHWMREGLCAFQKLVEPEAEFCFSDRPSLADVCLIPQLYNANRWGVDCSEFGRLMEIEKRCLALKGFQAAAPENQRDALK